MLSLSCGVQALYCGTWAQLPSAMWDLSSLTGAQTHVPCILRWILHHQTTREVPKMFFSSAYGNLYYHQHCRSVPMALHTHQHEFRWFYLLLLQFWWKCSSIMFWLIPISLTHHIFVHLSIIETPDFVNCLMINEVKYLCICFLAIWMSSFEELLLTFFGYFATACLFHWFVGALYIFWIGVLIR